MTVMRFMKKTEGYISIFLCLVLLPMVTFATMVIDVSRLQSVKNIISGAGDLTMNAGLSEYEQVLQDMYGLFATVESNDDLENALEKYFTQTIKSSLSSSSAEDDEYIQKIAMDLANRIMGSTSSESIDFTNYLNMSIEDDSFTYEAVDGSALANSAVLKRQIIDYMKYKGPVSLANTLFSKLDFLKNTSKQSNAVQKKVDYANSLNAIQDPCEKAYGAIIGTDVDDKASDEGYNDKVQGYNKAIENDPVNKSFEKLKEMYGYMSRYILCDKQSPYESEWTYNNMKKMEADNINQCINPIKDMKQSDYDEKTAKLDEINRKYNDIIVNDFSPHYGKVVMSCTFNEEDSSYSTTVKFDENPDSATYYPRWGNMDRDIGTLNEYKKTQSSEDLINLPKAPYKNSDLVNALDERYELQVQVYGSEEYVASFAGYYEKIYELNKMSENIWQTYESDFEEHVRSEYLANNPDAEDEDVEAEVESQKWNNDDYKSRIKNHLILSYLAQRFDEYKEKYCKYIKEVSDTSVYEKAGDYFALQAYGELYDYYDHIKKCESTVKTVIEILGSENETGKNTVLSKINEAEEKKNEWSSAIDEIGSGGSADSVQANFRSDYETMTDGLNKDDVIALKKVAEECQSYFKTLREEIESITFFNKSIYKGTTITDPPTYKKQSVYKESHTLDQIDTIEKINNIAKEINDANLKFGTFNAADFKKGNKLDGKDVDESKDVDEEKFFKTLKSICNPVKVEEVDAETKKEVEFINNAASVDEDGKPNTTAIEDEESESGGEGSAALTSEDFETILNNIKEYCDTNRNNPPQSNSDPSEYNVQSANASTSKEDYTAEGQSASSSLANATSLLSKFGNIVNTAAEYSYMEEYFTELFTCQTDKLDSDSDWALLNGYGKDDINQETEWFGKEIEYIIWGGADLDKNLVKNEAMIFTIRFALNAIYAFTAADIQSFALEVATATAGWTVIGVPIVQACITVAIAMAESAMDLHELKQGKDVPIYKNASNFICSPTGALKNIAEKITQEAINKCASQLESKLNNIIDSVTEAGYKKISEATNEIQEYVDDYISEQSNNIKSLIENQFLIPILNKITPIINDVDSGVDELENLVIQAIDESFATIEKNIDGMQDGVVKELTRALYNKVLSEGGKDEVVSTVTGYLEKVKIEVDTESITDMFTGETGIITKWLEGFKDTINAKMTSLNEQLMNKIKEHGDEAIDNLKSVIHDEIGNVSEKIGGSITETLTKTISENTFNVTSKIDPSAASGGFTLNYKEYCKIFVLINIIADQEKMLQRCGALVQANVRHAKENANESFDIRNANTLVYVDASIKMKTFFPWCVSATENTATGESGVEADLSHLGSNYVTIDYSGINGY